MRIEADCLIEVYDLEESLGIEGDVGWFKVAMGNIASLQVAQSNGQLEKDKLNQPD